MNNLLNRRDLLKLAGMGVAVFVSGTTVRAGGSSQKENESFYFVQLSDTHWGFSGPNINPDSQGTLKKAVEKANGTAPKFVQDFRKILDDKSIDIVSIATPNHWHALMAIWALQAGKHVYVEKPVDSCPENMTHRWIAGKRTRSFSVICITPSITVEFISSVSTMFQTLRGASATSNCCGCNPT